MEFTLLFSTLVAAAAIWVASRLRYRSDPTAVNNAAFEVVLNAAVIGLVTGRIWAMIAAGTNPITNLGDVIVVRGGVDPLGATLGALGALAWTNRRHGLKAWDALAPVALWGLAGWHAGCLVTDSCLGVPSSLPWAMSEAGSTIGRHPVELYTAGLLAIGAITLARLRSQPAGVVAAGALLVAATARFITEPLRLALGGGRIALYGIGMAVGLAAVAGLLRWGTSDDEFDRSGALPAGGDPPPESMGGLDS